MAGMIDVFRNDCEMFNIIVLSVGVKIVLNVFKFVVMNLLWGK